MVKKHEKLTEKHGAAEIPASDGRALGGDADRCFVMSERYDV